MLGRGKYIWLPTNGRQESGEKIRPWLTIDDRLIIGADVIVNENVPDFQIAERVPVQNITKIDIEKWG